MRIPVWKGNEHMKGKCITVVLGGVIAAMMISILSAQPEKITLENVEAYKKKRRPPVHFPHEVHMAGDLACTDCHHRYENGKNILDESELEEGTPNIQCRACHTTQSRVNLRRAFHRQCIGCHRREKRGPRLCGECHMRTPPK